MALSPRSAARRYGAGSARTHCGPGAIAAGYSHATRTSLPKPAPFWTSTNVAGKVLFWGLATMFFALTRRPAFKPDAARIAPCQRPQDAPLTSSMNMHARAPGHTSRPGTFIVPSCSGGASTRPESLHSSASSRRSCAGNPTAPLAECSGSPTTDPLIAANQPALAFVPDGRTSCSSIRRSMPAGSIRSRYTSRSYNVNYLPRTTSEASLISGAT